jgi:hypothetical protein
VTHSNESWQCSRNKPSWIVIVTGGSVLFNKLSEISANIVLLHSFVLSFIVGRSILCISLTHFLIMWGTKGSTIKSYEIFIA